MLTGKEQFYSHYYSVSATFMQPVAGVTIDAIFKAGHDKSCPTGLSSGDA